jgi:hypothetical protein
VSFRGFGFIPDINKPNQLTVAVNLPIEALLTKPGPDYIILDVNYDSYVVVYTCIKNEMMDIESLFVLSRTITLQDLTDKKLKQLLNRYTRIDIDELINVSQENCPAPPSP